MAVVDWLTDDAQRQNHDLWGGVSGYKTKYDPCPGGLEGSRCGRSVGIPQGVQEGRRPQRRTALRLDHIPGSSSTTTLIASASATKQADSGKEYWFPFTGKKIATRVT